MTPERYRKIAKVLDQRQMDLTVLMEHVETPHNLAAIARTCDAVGIFEAHAVSRLHAIDLKQRASSGSRKWISVKTHESLETAFGFLRSKGFAIYCAHLDDKAMDFRSVDYTRPTAVVLGTELEGVSPEAVALSDGCVMVPMFGMIQSLNVSVATALILYEAQRQRMEKGLYHTRHLDDERYNSLMFEWGYPRLSPYYKVKRLPYPRLDENGQIVKP
jgi:tRNA (guanosine-2'-O-)-methyltransferase